MEMPNKYAILWEVPPYSVRKCFKLEAAFRIRVFFSLRRKVHASYLKIEYKHTIYLWHILNKSQNDVTKTVKFLKLYGAPFLIWSNFLWCTN